MTWEKDFHEMATKKARAAILPPDTFRDEAALAAVAAEDLTETTIDDLINLIEDEAEEAAIDLRLRLGAFLEEILPAGGR